MDILLDVAVVDDSTGLIYGWSEDAVSFLWF